VSSEPNTGSTDVVENRKGSSTRLRVGAFDYKGAFRLPFGENGASSFSYGGTAIAFNPHRRSLFIVGHDHHQAIAEVAVPDIVNSDRVEDLKTAKILQPFTAILARIPNWTLEGGCKIGGLLVNGNELIGTVYEFYDAEGNAVDSHFKLSSLDLKKANVTGLFRAGRLGGGFVAGYMAHIPNEWKDKLGASQLTGQAALSIISRTSAGPAAFAFNASDLGPNAAQVMPLAYYPLAKRLAREDTQNPLFNTTTQITGLVFPTGTDELWFFGTHGTGPWWYGENGDGQNMHDPAGDYKGPHAYPYVFQAWVYSAHDLLAARKGTRQPWDIKPKDVLTFDLPFSEGSKRIGGAAYDPATRLLYISQLRADRLEYDMNPLIHVFQLAQ
jgi:hypothetical protein